MKRNIYLILCLQDDLEAELLDTPEREPVSSSSSGKPRRNFGTCNAESGGGARRRVAAARGVARRVARASSHSREGRPNLRKREDFTLKYVA